MVKAIREILKVFAECGLFDEGVELIGSWCFKLYEKHLGAKSFPLLTQDIDFLIPTPWRGQEHKDFIKRLEALGFNCEFKRDGSLYLWNAELKIEFIAPEKGKGTEDAVKVKKLGIDAIPLRFVGMLLKEPITIREDGIGVLVPNPAAFCLHKLIISSRRKKDDKSIKDLQQAICTSVIVDSSEIRALFDTLPKGWKQAILRVIDKAPKVLPLLREEINGLSLTLQTRK